MEIHLQGYRDLSGKFEHEGPKNYRIFYERVDQVLKNNSLLLLHTIGNRFSDRSADPFTESYIFSNSVIPSVYQIGDVTEKLLLMEDWHNFGHYYDPILMAWIRNFDEGWDHLKPSYSDTFYHMWQFFVCSDAVSFGCQKMQLWQIVFSKKKALLVVTLRFGERVSLSYPNNC